MACPCRAISHQAGISRLVLLDIEYVLLGATVDIEDIIILICADGIAQFISGKRQWQEFLCVPEQVECEDQA